MYEKMVDSVFPVLKKLSVHPVFSFPTSDGKPETAVFRQKQFDGKEKTAVFRQKQFDKKVETLFPA